MEADQSIAYISDVGAEFLQPLFIAGSCVTTVFLDLAFASERWLRHTGDLERNTTRVEKILSGFAIFFAVCGTAGLILLSIFDTRQYPHLHDGFLLLFIAGYIISAIFLCAEYQRLGIHYRNRRILRISFWVKLAFILVECMFSTLLLFYNLTTNHFFVVFLAIAFAACDFSNGTQNAAAILEWIVALIFTFWVLSFFIDLLPATHHRHRRQDAQAAQVEMGNGYAANGGMTSHTSTATTINGYPNETPVTNGHANGLKPARPVTPSANF
jgi:hypothetical protein